MTERTGSFRIPRQKRIRLITPRSVYTKFTWIYTLCYTAAFALGCLLFHMAGGVGNALLDRRITGFFSASLSGCADAFEFARRLLSFAAQDLTRLLMLFAAGFTVFVSFAVAGFLAFRGLSFGFAVSYLVAAVRQGELAVVGVSSLVLFSVFGALGTALMIHLGVRTTMFSDEFKALCGRPRLILRSRALYVQILRYIIATGAVLLLTMARCVL